MVFFRGALHVSLSVRPSGRLVCPRSARLRSTSVPRPVRSPRPFWTSFPFYSLFPSSFAQLDSDAAEQLDVDVRGSAFPTTLINGGGKESVALTEPPSIQPRPNLQPGAWSLPASSTPTCRACRLFLEASLPLSRAAESYSWEAALLRKGVKCWQKKKKKKCFGFVIICWGLTQVSAWSRQLFGVQI